MKGTEKMEKNDYKSLLENLWKEPEGKNIDFKTPFVLSKDLKKEMYGLVKDILAMANTEGGGHIIIGRRDCGRAVDCEQDILRSFDPTKVHDCAKNYGKPEPKFTVKEVESPEKTTAILIHVEEFEEHLIICVKDAADGSNKSILQAGAIYIRSKTGNATSEQVKSEQDMRSLIHRSMIKSGQGFRRILDQYFKGLTQVNPLIDNKAAWKKEEKILSDKIDSTLSLKEHFLMQISAHPVIYDPQSLQNGEILKEKLLDSVRGYRGWSFPWPYFKLEKLDILPETPQIIGNFSRSSLGGELQSGFAFSLSGLMLYREELLRFYDKATPGKPLFLMPCLMTIYRALGFFGRFFEFTTGNKRLSLQIQFTDTYNRIPAYDIMKPLDHVISFGESEALPFPKIELNLEIERGDISSQLDNVFYRVASELMDQMEIEISDEQLLSKLEEITKPQ